MTPQQLAQQRSAAIEQLEAQVAAAAEGAQRELYERLLAQLKDIQADPTTLYGILAEYQRAVLVPLAYTYGQAMLNLPALNVAYFQGLDVAGYQALKAPLTDFLAARLGVDATGAVVSGGYLDLLAGSTVVRQQVLIYAFNAQAGIAGAPGSAGLNAYREGLRQLVLGGDRQAEGLVSSLYREAADDFSKNDRKLQSIAGERLGLTASLYQGGLIDSSRLFCVVRNGKVFLDSEIELFGTSKDAFGGYTNKKAGLFSGKTTPYTPEVDAGGHKCRHTYHRIPNLIALRMRPELAENDKGELYIK